MELINTINSLIRWYENSYEGATVHELMTMKTSLLINCYSLAEVVASSKKKSVISTVVRKYQHHKVKSQLIEQGFTLGAAESKTIEQVKDAMKAEAEAEALNVHYRLVLDYATKIAEDLTQRISVLRTEMNTTQQI